MTKNITGSGGFKPKHQHYYDRYVVLNQDMATELAEADLTPTQYKLMFAALGRMNDKGHAEFGRSELKRILRVKDRTTIWRAKRDLWKRGFLASGDGGETCVWVNIYAVAFRQGSGSKCVFRHRDVA